MGQTGNIVGLLGWFFNLRTIMMGLSENFRIVTSIHFCSGVPCEKGIRLVRHNVSSYLSFKLGEN